MTSKVAELEPGQGYNAVTGTYGDLYADGVIDPVKVTRSALANAARSPHRCSPRRPWWWRSPRRRSRRRPAIAILTDGSHVQLTKGPSSFEEGPLWLRRQQGGWVEQPGTGTQQIVSSDGLALCLVRPSRPNRD